MRACMCVCVRACTHRHDSTQTVPKTANILQERNQQARLDGDLAVSRQALCSVLQETLLAEGTVRQMYGCMHAPHARTSF